MGYRLILILLFFVSAYLAKADGGSTYLYHFKIDLINHTTIDAYFINTDYYQPSDLFVNICFQNENFLRGFLFQKATDRNGKLEKLDTNLFRILEYPSVDDWIRGHIVISKCERLSIPEKDIARIKFISRQSIPGQEITNLTDLELTYLAREPVGMVSLKLEDDIQAIGDVYIEYLLVSYNKDKNTDLKKIKTEIEAAYLLQASSCESNEKLRVWQKIFSKHKVQLLEKQILFLEIIEF